jgi:hypothetical protein
MYYLVWAVSQEPVVQAVQSGNMAGTAGEKELTGIVELTIEMVHPRG